MRDIGSLKSGIVSFTYAGITEDLKQKLFKSNINVSWNGVSNTLLDMTERGLTEVVRASVHYYNSEEEIEVFIKALKNLS